MREHELHWIRCLPSNSLAISSFLLQRGHLNLCNQRLLASSSLNTLQSFNGAFEVHTQLLKRHFHDKIDLLKLEKLLRSVFNPMMVFPLAVAYPISKATPESTSGPSSWARTRSLDSGAARSVLNILLFSEIEPLLINPLSWAIHISKPSACSLLSIFEL